MHGEKKRWDGAIQTTPLSQLFDLEKTFERQSLHTHIPPTPLFNFQRQTAHSTFPHILTNLLLAFDGHSLLLLLFVSGYFFFETIIVSVIDDKF